MQVTGSLRPSRGVAWSQMPPGLHVVDTSLTGNAAATGAAIRAAGAAVYLDSVEVSGNKASRQGGGVHMEQGLLVALGTTFDANHAGASSNT